MPLPVIADTIRVEVSGLCQNGRPWANVFHVAKQPATSYATAIAALDPLVNNLYQTALGGGTSWKAAAPAAATLAQIRYTPLDGSSASTIIVHPTNGSAAGDAMPPDVCLVISLRTGLRGPRRRGRVYWGPQVEASNDGAGRATSSVYTGFATQWATFMTNLIAANMNLMVTSYVGGGNANVTSVVVDPRWDHQHRRRSRS